MRKLLVLSCILAISLSATAAPALASPGAEQPDTQSPRLATAEIAARRAQFREEAASPVAVASSGGVLNQQSAIRPAGAALYPVYRFTDIYNGSQYLTYDVGDAELIFNGYYDIYQYDGVAFFFDPVLDTAPIYRMYNTRKDTYYYADAAERQWILTYVGFMYEDEGEAFRRTNSSAGTVPLYSFISYEYYTGYNYRVLTVSDVERQRLVASGSLYLQEGTYGYVRPAPVSGTGSISGVVTAPDGSPLAGYLVHASLYGDAGTWCAVTNASGQYTIASLPAGDYFMSFTTWPAFYEAGWNYMPEYYNDAQAPALHSPVTVIDGALTSGINARLDWFPQPVYRFYNFKASTHFYTPSADEAVTVMNTLAHTFQYEGVCYWLDPSNNAQQLYRFHNFRNGSHFYTADDGEANYIMSRLGGTYNYDGRTYAVNQAPVPNSLPVYRFYNSRVGCHFYTADEAERAHVEATLRGTYTPEGPVYWLGQ